jgi:hypothetical protein
MRYLLTKYNNIIFLAVIAIIICANIAYAQTPGTIILGRPTNTSITANILADKNMDVYLEYGTKASIYNAHTNIVQCIGKQPMELAIEGLQPDRQYYYRMQYRQSGKSDYAAGDEYSFHTQRLPGSAFAFAIQGDSHPERINKMYDPDLYLQTMQNVVKDRPDFYMTLGDDFSIDPLINKNQLNQQTVDDVYINQRGFLGVVGSSSPLFLVNGNHEEAAQYLLDGTPNNPAVFAGKARTKLFPLPASDAFYSGDTEQVEFVGLPRDYYAWTWGDALFVVIDFYWHSPVPVDNVAGSDAGKQRDMWSITLGDTQYQWFKETLEQSNAKYKFVFSHHVLGTGRGGVESADGYEWGGKGKNGTWEFDKMRSGWEMPIHQLMVKNGVTIFFQGHDHLFAYQKKDGIVYQSVPNPADPKYQAFNSDAYTGDILPNSGHLLITVAPDQVKVDYIRSFLPKDESNGQKNGEVAYSYATKNETNVDITKTPGTIILGRPTDKSVTANILTDGNMNIYFEYGTKSSVYTNHTDIIQCIDKKPVEVVIDNLEPDTQYYYRMLYIKPGGNNYTAGEEYNFHTQRSISAFSFVVEADPHLDEQSNPDLYKRALLNELSYRPW